MLEEEEDKWVWKEDKNGIYSIKLAYQVIKANIGGAKDVLFFEKMWVRVRGIPLKV